MTSPVDLTASASAACALHLMSFLHTPILPTRFLKLLPADSDDDSKIKVSFVAVVPHVGHVLQVVVLMMTGQRWPPRGTCLFRRRS